MSDSNGEISSLVHRINLVLAAQDRHIVAFIAARSGEGTSTVARDFAEGLADETGRKVLLIDAGPLDKARCITDGIDPATGIVDTVAAGDQPAKVIHAIDHNVYLGRWMGKNENRALAGKLLHNAAFWASLQKEFDTIVIDAPSLQNSSDGIALATRADAVIMVIESETTRQPVIENLRDTLAAAGAKITGSVMNKRRFYIPDKVYARL